MDGWMMQSLTIAVWLWRRHIVQRDGLWEKPEGFRFIKWLRNVSFNMIIGVVLMARPILLECQGFSQSS